MPQFHPSYLRYQDKIMLESTNWGSCSCSFEFGVWGFKVSEDLYRQRFPWLEQIIIPPTAANLAVQTSTCNGKHQHPPGFLSASTESLTLLPVAIGWGHTSFEFEYPLHSIVEPGFVRHGHSLHFDFERQRRFDNCSNSINKWCLRPYQVAKVRLQAK